MNENLGIKEILDWYITAGVDEICGEVPFALAEPEQEVRKPLPVAAVAAARRKVLPARQPPNWLRQQSAPARVRASCA